ncbi:glycosyltransferase family 9 protein [Nisaea sp.]|uniref:glycosyltransferase family 9 protein n=1 Tax=Nisaea sp. TaxID=2024842 RepID=UPI003B52AC70
MTKRPETVLIYSCGETIGDGLFKLPFLVDLRARFPDAKITWLAGLGPSMYAKILAPIVAPLLDEVIEHAGIGDDLGALLPWAPRPLKGRHFDLVIDTQMTVRRSLNARRIRHDRFISPAAGFLLSDAKPKGGAKPDRHLLKALTFLADLAAPRPDTMLAFDPIAPEYRSLAAELLPDGPTYVGIAPGAGDTVKVWPEANFLAVAKEQVARGRVPVFLAGPEEAEKVPAWRAAVPEALFPEWDRHDIRPDLKGPVLVMALAGRLSAALANDSGSGHMLATGGAPLVSLFSKHDPAKYAPSATRLTIVDSKDYGGKDPELIPLGDVVAAVDGMVAH